MKKTNIILILVAMLSLLGLGGVVLLFGDTKKEEEAVRKSDQKAVTPFPDRKEKNKPVRGGVFSRLRRGKKQERS